MKTNLLSIAFSLAFLWSASAQQGVTVSFTNSTNGPVDLYWVDFDGNEVNYGQLPQGATHQQPTYPTHTWRYKSGNQLLGTMTASNLPVQQVVIQRGNPAPAPAPVVPQPAPVVNPGGGGAALNNADAQQLLQLVNQARAQVGAPALRYNAKLNSASQKHTADMAARGYFSHTAKQPAPNGGQMSERAQREGYQFSALAENIANGQTTVQQVFNGWMNSPGHKGNILNPAYAEMGIGRAGVLWTQMFGKSW